MAEDIEDLDDPTNPAHAAHGGPQARMGATLTMIYAFKKVGLEYHEWAAQYPDADGDLLDFATLNGAVPPDEPAPAEEGEEGEEEEEGPTDEEMDAMPDAPAR